MTANEMEKLLHDKIPISVAMNISVMELTAQSLRLFIPLEENKNHVGTLFGGSLYSAGALACYGLFLATLRDHGETTKNVVAAEGHIFYKEPVDGNCVIEAQWNPLETQAEFFQNLARWKKARTEMKAQMLVRGKLCAEFSALFVARI